MNKFTLLFVLFVALTSTVMAADKAGDACPTTGYISQTNSGEILSCVDGKLKHTSQVGTRQITVSVQLLEGVKSLVSTVVTTLDGQPVPVNLGTERSYIAKAKKEGDKVVLTPGTVKDGFFMTLTPTLTKDGKIEVAFEVIKSEVTSFSAFKQGDLEVQLPQVSTIELKHKVALDSSKPIEIPFGQLVMPPEGASVPMSAHTQYTLKIFAL